MIFGKIDYLNLLPFYVFMKRYIRSSQIKASINYRKGVPAQINRDFKRRKIDAAFISSIASRGSKCTDIGIIARQEVWSVLVCPGECQEDSESATSNALAQLLGVEGHVLIGDKALKRYLADDQCIDLAKEWHDRYKLPFVFARLCYHRNDSFFEQLAQAFAKRRVRIPRYILMRYAQKTGIKPEAIMEYLSKIEYQMDSEAKRSLTKFLKLTRAKSNIHSKY